MSREEAMAKFIAAEEALKREHDAMDALIRWAYPLSIGMCVMTVLSVGTSLSLPSLGGQGYIAVHLLCRGWLFKRRSLRHRRSMWDAANVLYRLEGAEIPFPRP